MICYCDNDGKIYYVYILNGLGFVVGCIVVVILENY